MSYRFNNGVPKKSPSEHSLSGDHQPRQRSRSLCAGSLDGQSLDHPGRYTVRLLRHELPGTDRWAGASRRLGTSHFPRRTTSRGRTSPIGAGFAYDLFGTGKTAVKVAFNKYLLGQTLNGLGRNPNPVADAGHPGESSVGRSRRPGPIGDFVPQCDLQNPLANGECGPIDNLRSAPRRRATVRPGSHLRVQPPPGQLGVLGRRAARDRSGHGARRRLLPPRLGHFHVTDNTLVGPEDFTQFSMVAPTDPRLPDGGGYTIDRFLRCRAGKAARFATSTRCRTTTASRARTGTAWM